MSFPVTVQYIMSLSNCTLDESTVTTRLAAIDQDVVRVTKASKFTSQVWNGTSSINGATAEQVLASVSIPSGGKAYLVKDVDANHFITFQYYKPEVSGFVAMTQEEADTYGAAEKNTVIDNAAVAAIVETVLNPS